MAGLSCLRTATTATVPASPPLYRLFLLITGRCYKAAAAQPQLDPDFYYGDDYDWRRDRLGSVPMEDSEGSLPKKRLHWAFIGSPRAKKHVYAEMLSKLLDVPHISMASLVRQDLNPSSSLYKQIANALNHGELVPEDILFGLLSKRLEDGYYRGETGFILDGIPRSLFQAEILDQLADIDLVVNFKCTEDILAKHPRGSMLSRYNDSGEKSNSRSKSFDISPLHSQSIMSPANAKSIWKEKHHFHEDQWKLLEDYYRKQRKLLDFQVGTAAPGETWQGLLAALHLQHINAVHSSQKPTAGYFGP